MLSQIIEYLSAQGLARPARLQFVMPIVPAGMQINFSLAPPLGAYAAIKYGMSYYTVPGSIYLEVTQAGNKYSMGTIEADHMRELIPYWIMYTVREPIMVLLQNISPLSQKVIGTQFMILIDTDVLLERVKKEIAALGTSESVQLAKQANALLEAICRGEPTPRKPHPSTGGI